MKFLVDRMLGRLATWLRVLGFDAAYYNGPYSRTINYTSLKENRVILTRNRKVGEKRSFGVVHITADHLKEQIQQVVRVCGIVVHESRLFNRCTYCNVPVEPAEKKNMYGKVPIYVYNTCTEFSACPRCRRIYWKGTHNDLLKEQINAMHVPITKINEKNKT